MDQILRVFDKDRIQLLDKMFMCGNYGDPAAGYYTLDIYREFRKINPDIILGMNSNGGIQSTFWWHELGKIMTGRQDYVVFSIDGLEDTNSIYRINVNWNKIISNVEAFISAGGSAHWDMLIYRHNEHQVDACEQLAKSLGFKWFRAKVSKRPLIESLEAPIKWSRPDQVPSTISCHALNEKSIYIDAQGRVSPCCWLGSRQNHFIKDFDLVQQSWSSEKPEATCIETCGIKDDKTNFEKQWQIQKQL